MLSPHFRGPTPMRTELARCTPASMSVNIDPWHLKGMMAVRVESGEAHTGMAGILILVRISAIAGQVTIHGLPRQCHG